MMNKEFRIIVLLSTIFAIIFSTFAIFLPIAGYTVPGTGVFVSAETLAYVGHTGIAYQAGTNYEVPMEYYFKNFLFIFLILFAIIMKIVIPIFGVISIYYFINKRERNSYIYSLSGGTIGIVVLILYFLFTLRFVPESVTLADGPTVYVFLTLGTGFYFILISIMCFFISYGLNSYILKEEEKSIESKTETKELKKDVNLVDIIKMRYAKGEITKEEYEQIKEDLEDK